MSQPAYATSLKDIVARLSLAVAEAEAELPEDIKKTHWIEVKKNPCAWAITYHKAIMDGASYSILTALLACWKALDAAESLRGVLIEVESLDKPPPDLKLGKMRRE